jgi:hypothetical protein
MIRQYYAQRCGGGPNPLRVGVIPAGAIFCIQDDGLWRDRYRGRPVCREPWIVEAFLNGTVGAGRRNAEIGRWEDVYVAGRSDMALVRSLRTGRRRQLAVRMLILHEDEGLRRDDATYPDLPLSHADGRLPAVSNRAANRPSGRVSPPLQRRPSVVHIQPGAPAAA